MHNRNINNIQIDYAKDLDVVMPMYNLIENSDNYSKTSGSLWQYHRDEPAVAIENSESFKFKVKITAKTLATVKIAVPLKILTQFLEHYKIVKL